MGYRITEKDYLRYISELAKYVRLICMLALVVTVVLSLTVYRKDITSENFRFLLKNIDLDTGAFSVGESMQISFRAGGDTIAGYLRGDIVLLSRGGYETYDFTGKRVIDVSHSFSNPALKTSQRYALVYDVAGKELDIYNAFTDEPVFRGEYPYGVFNAIINDDDSFAVVTSESTYKSGAVVYNSSFKEIFRWMSASLTVTSIDMPGNKDKLLTAGVKVDGGDFITEINCFDTSEQEPIFEITVEDEFPLAVEYTDKGFFLLSDKSLTFFDKNGVQTDKHIFAKGSVTKYFNFDSAVAISLSDGIADSETVRIFSSDGNEGTGVSIPGGVLDAASFGSTAYILEPGKLHMMNLVNRNGAYHLEYKNVEKVEVDKLVTRVFASSADEYILVSSNGAGKYN